MQIEVIFYFTGFTIAWPIEIIKDKRIPLCFLTERLFCSFVQKWLNCSRSVQVYYLRLFNWMFPHCLYNQISGILVHQRVTFHHSKSSDLTEIVGEHGTSFNIWCIMYFSCFSKGKIYFFITQLWLSMTPWSFGYPKRWSAINRCFFQNFSIHQVYRETISHLPHLFITNSYGLI